MDEEYLMRQGKVNKTIQNQILNMNIKAAIRDHRFASKKVMNRFDSERILPSNKPKDFMFKDEDLKSSEIQDMVSQISYET